MRNKNIRVQRTERSRKLTLWIPAGLTLLLIISGMGMVGWQIRQDRLDTALIKAIEESKEQEAVRLLRQGANCEAKKMAHNRLSFWERLAQLLKQRKPAVDTNRPTALMLAVDLDEDQVVRALLNRGAKEVNANMLAEYDDGSIMEGEALLLSTEEPEIARALLKKGANVHVKYTQGRRSGDTAIYQFILEYDWESITSEKDIKAWVTSPSSTKNMTMLEVLLEYGADIEGRDADTEVSGHTPLMEAAAHSRIAMIKFLLNHGARINARDDEGNTPLMCAISQRQEEMIEFLLKQGADPNLQDNKGQSALIRAVLDTEGNAKAINHLLAAGARVNQTDNYGMTALDYADYESNLNPAYVKILRKAGAVTSTELHRKN